jgi:hypothetical protein
MSPILRSALLLLTACQLTEPHQLPTRQLPAPCAGCLTQGNIDADDDGDGYCEDATACADGALPGDCDDNLATAFPAAPELGDLIDQDCDGTHLDGLDDDLDGYTTQLGDCNDQNPADSPELTRTCCEDDADGDGLCDAVDDCPNTQNLFNNDADRDGLDDACDTCPAVPNATHQIDSDGDGLGDDCDPCPGWLGLGQLDRDQDGLCDLDPADTCFGPEAVGDADGDGFCELPTVLLSRADPTSGDPDENNSPSKDPAVAYCADVQRYLVVWTADSSSSGQRQYSYDIWGTVLDASGTPLTAPTRLTYFQETSEWGDAITPAVACNTHTQQFVLAFTGTDGEGERVYTLPVGIDGRARGGLHRITHLPGSAFPTGNTESGLNRNPSLAFDEVNGRFLIAYSATRSSFNRADVHAKLLDGDGRTLPLPELRLTDVGPYHIAGHVADYPAVAWSRASGRFLVAHVGPDRPGKADEVFLALVSPHGTPLLTEQQVTEMGSALYDRTRWARRPALTPRGDGEVMLLTWHGSDDASGLAPEKGEIFARLVSDDATPVTAPVRLSQTGDPADPEANATTPTAAWDAIGRRFLVAWSGAPNTPGWAREESDIFGRELSALGVLIGPDVDRLTFTLPDGQRRVRGEAPQLIANPLLGGATLIFQANASVPHTPQSEAIQQRAWGQAPAPDTDGDGIVDPIDPCAGPSDLDGDGRVWCLVGDPDGDCDDSDRALGGDLDADGQCDALDPCPLSASNDADNDGTCDHIDRCLGDDTQGDLDADALCDDLDPCPLSPTDDADSDGLCDDLDPCLGAQSTGDSDNDGVCDDRDLCTGDDLEDADNDGLPDACDPCPLDATDDTDGDGLCDSNDRCWGVNTSGDADNDGRCDAQDPCPTSNPNDLDGDGLCDANDACLGLNSSGDPDNDGVCTNLDPCRGNNASADVDNDRLCGNLDPCFGLANNDADNDGFCNDLDACLGDDLTGDADSDGTCDDLDPCFGLANNDADNDELCDDLDACLGDDLTGDADSDGTCDDLDLCFGPAGASDTDADRVCDPLDQCDGDDSSGDSDGDGLCDNLDACPGPVNFGDADQDGLCDNVDLCFGTDLTGDADADGTCDDLDPCFGPAGAPDADGDGVCDPLDQCDGDDSSGDADNDGLCDNIDLCEGLDASGDSDGDGFCDAIDACVGEGAVGDLDSDGLCGDLDLCPTVADLVGTDSDNDLIGDLCDLCPATADDGQDADNDGLGDACDPCPAHTGAGQADLDLDGLCDLDPADLCFGPDAAGDLNGDGDCDVPHLLLSLAGAGPASEDAAGPALSLSTTSQRTLVVWRETGTQPGPSEIWGRLLDARHRPVTPPLPLTDWNDRGASAPTIAWNSRDDTHLLAFVVSSTSNDREIGMQLLGPDASPRGEAWQATDNPSASSFNRIADQPHLTYNADADEFLLVYRKTHSTVRVYTGWIGGDSYIVPKYEIYSRRFDGAGRPLGTEDLRVSVTGGRGDYERLPSEPRALWSSPLQRYVEVHTADTFIDGRHEVLLTLLDAEGYGEGYPEPPSLQLNVRNPGDTYDALAPAIAHSLTSDVYLVVFRMVPPTGAEEIYGRLLDQHAQPTGPMFPISQNGLSHPNATALPPAVVWDEGNDQFLVAWTTNGTVAGEREVYQQVVRVDGTLALPTDARQSFVGVDGDSDRDADALALAYSPLTGSPLLVFVADGPEWGGVNGANGIWLTAPADLRGPDSDNDGTPDALDLCAGTDDADQDGRVWCATGLALFDCDDNDPSRGADRDGDGLCDPDDPCPIDPGNDADNDGTCSNADLCLGVNSSGDSDGDRLCDDTDPCPLSPRDDADNDGTCDDLDLCLGDDATGDSDGDGLCGDIDTCLGDNGVDSDRDRVPDACDPCPEDAPDDSDGDGVCTEDDACDGDDTSGNADNDAFCDDSDVCFGNNNSGDDDSDGVCNNLDVCEGDDATGDADGDSTCDELDACFGRGLLPDSDGDGTCDEYDLCTGLPDRYTADLDLDGVGDTCDNCPLFASGDQTDSDGDGLGDACDPCPGRAELRQGDLDLDGLCDLDAADLCYGPESYGDADGDGLCDTPAVLLSQPRADQSVSYAVTHPHVAWSPTSRRYLVVWESNNGEDSWPEGGEAIWGRVVDPLGRPLAPAARLFQAVRDHVPLRSLRPVVTWNPDDDQFLVAFTAVDDEQFFDVYVGLVDPDGRPLGEPLPISSPHVFPGHPTASKDPAVVYVPSLERYFVYFQSSISHLHNHPNTQVFVREVDRSGLPRGASGTQISDYIEPHDDDGVVGAIAVAASARHQNHLVVFTGNSYSEPARIFGHLVGEPGTVQPQLGQLDLSDPEQLDPLTTALAPDVAYSETSDAYLVVWQEKRFAALPTVEKREIYATMLSGTGEVLVPNWRVSFTGVDTDSASAGLSPDVLWDPARDQFVVLWSATPGTDGLAPGESEVFSRRITPAGAMGPVTRVTRLGDPQDDTVDALSPQAAYNELLREVYVVFRGDDRSWGDTTGTYRTWSARHEQQPTQDTDSDGVIDALDLCNGADDLDGDGYLACVSGPLGDCDDADPTTAADRDQDGLCDRTDLCLGDELSGDSDGDGVCDDLDACAGPDSYDLDRDGLPDACDPCPLDRDDDLDGVCADLDLCDGDDSLGDADNDGLCDDLDPCPTDAPDDSDGDGSCDSLDLCEGDDARGDADNDGFCEAELTALDPLVPGLRTRFRVRNARPGAQVVLLLTTTTTPGPTVCHPSAPTACTRLQSRRVVGSRVVEALSETTWNLQVPATVPSGARVALQALWFDPATGDGESSQVLQLTAQ